jgi:hypothetical protein
LLEAHAMIAEILGRLIIIPLELLILHRYGVPVASASAPGTGFM